MNKPLALIFILIFLMPLCIIIVQPAKAASKTITVPNDFSTIQEAIDNATAGDTVFVRNGIYYAPITIDKPLSLIGEDSQNTIIGGGPVLRFQNSFVVKVTAEDVMISGFNIKNASDSTGIWIDYENYQLPMPSRCKIVGNNIEDTGLGISSQSGENQFISANNITGNGLGILVGYSNSSIISENNITGNNLGVNVAGGNLTIRNNNLLNNSMGGLMSSETDACYVYGNNIIDNQLFGIQFANGCDSIIVHDNNIKQNVIGIYLENYAFDEDTAGASNVVYRNNFVNNLQQVFVEKAWRYSGNFPNYTGNNGTDIVSWDNGKEGNYWSDYQTKYPNAKEIDSTGIGNTPYVIDSNNADRYPLIYAVTVPEFPSVLVVCLLMAAIFAGTVIFKKKHHEAKITKVQ